MQAMRLRQFQRVLLVVTACYFPLAAAAGSALDCLQKLNETRHYTGARAQIALQLLIATGKDIPFNSGSYATCQNIEVAFPDYPTKFFITSFKAGSIAGEVGICLPAECSDPDFHVLQGVLTEASPQFAKLEGLTFPPTGLHYDMVNPFNNKDDLKHWGSGTTAAIVVFVLLVALVLTSTVATTVFESQTQQQSGQDAALIEGSPQPTVRAPRKIALFEAFSLVGENGTWTSLFKAQTRRPTDCLDGMRFFSMFFIVLGHGIEEPADIAGYSNIACMAKSPLCVNAIPTNVWSWWLLTGQLGVDTFFFIGGFLLSFIGKNRSVPVAMGTLLRYLRLLPLLGFVQMIYILIAPYMAFGPFGPRFQKEIDVECTSNSSWWSELLFINAFYPWFPIDGGCMGWTWYLGDDMVFAILGMVLLNVWKKNRRMGWALVTVSFLGCVTACIQQSLEYKMQYSLMDMDLYVLYSTHLYGRPYVRLPCFLIGLAAPWALDALERSGRLSRGTQPRTWFARTIVYTSCFLALIVAALCIFLPWTNAWGPGPYETAQKSGQWTLWESALWIALSRPVWCLCWLVWTLACYFDYLPLLNSILGAPIFNPLSNLTFGAYLCHPVIIKIIAGNVDGYFTFSIGETIQRAIIFAILAYAAAIVCWCLVEKPCATMTGWLIPKKKSPAKPVMPTDPESATGANRAS